MDADQRATIKFYEWEQRLRGYYHFDSVVRLEANFEPFRQSVQTTDIIDDGRVPNILERLQNFINPSKPIAEIPTTEAEEGILAYRKEPTTDLVGFSLVFPKGVEIQANLFRELLNLLSYTNSPISFEILGAASKINIQIISHPSESQRIQSQIQSYFPQIILQPLEDVFDIGIDMYSEDVAMCDFGLSEETMRPLKVTDSYTIDPLTSIISTLGSLEGNNVAMFQLLFQGVHAPWANNMQYAVSDGQGGSFFIDSPEMPNLAKEKISDPLFAVVMRIVVESRSTEQSRYLSQELIRNISTISRSNYNKLIPLSNEGYAYNDHLRNVFLRCSNRLGFILNTRELAHFVHYPNKSIVSSKLGFTGGKTKQPTGIVNDGIYLGDNTHNREITPIYLDIESRLSHCHILGATGTGKSTLIANMILADIEDGRGCALFDPHGDICDDVLKRIPEHRINDVIIIDPSDSEYPIGFNLLEANTEAEKIVLSSDLVSAFKRHATAWGDNMTAVLQNAVNTVLESTRGGTLIELKRFLIEESFRNEYLTSVDDPSLHYYWQHEYPMVRKGIAPLLTRIDTFLRPKLVRYMLAQSSGIDISECLRENKIVLLKLSQGLIGEQNSYLLGSLFLAKFNQSALARQQQSKEERTPYMLYLDEFQNFITPSIERILSGARKYKLGITIAHQELGQIQDTTLLNSVLSNPKTRICFRLGDNDAKKLESGFSYFEQSDLQNLNRGEAIMRIGSSTNDFNVTTKVLPEIETNFSQFIINQTRANYAQAKDEVESILYSMLPNIHKKQRTKQETVKKPIENITIPETIVDEAYVEEAERTGLEKHKEEILRKEEEREQESKHRAIQNYVLSLGQQRNFITQLEVETTNGGRIDVLLKKDALSIAVEVSVTNTIDYEIKNLAKCLEEDISHVYLISESKVHLANIKKKAKEEFESGEYKKIGFGSPSEFLTFLGKFDTKPTKSIKRVRGYRVKSSHVDLNDNDAKTRNQKIQDIILRGDKKKGNKNTR